MARCANVLVTDPETYRGQWLARVEGYDKLALELGCGRGRFTVETAKQSPDTLLVAVERVGDAMIIGMERAMREETHNIRFVQADALRLGEFFAPGELDRLYINFCDPWPRKGHAKRRLTHENFLKSYAPLLAPGGEIHFKTDNDALFEFSLEEFPKAGFTVSDVTRDLHQNGPTGVMTDYELKFTAQGVSINRCVAKILV